MGTFFSGYFLLKVLITVLIVAVFAALIASLPLTSLLAFIWLHVEGQEPQELAALSHQIFWLVILSLLFFLVFPLLLRVNLPFFIALLGAAMVTAMAYWGGIKRDGAFYERW